MTAKQRQENEARKQVASGRRPTAMRVGLAQMRAEVKAIQRTSARYRGLA